MNHNNCKPDSFLVTTTIPSVHATEFVWWDPRRLWGTRLHPGKGRNLKNGSRSVALWRGSLRIPSFQVLGWWLSLLLWWLHCPRVLRSWIWASFSSNGHRGVLSGFFQGSWGPLMFSAVSQYGDVLDRHPQSSIKGEWMAGCCCSTWGLSISCGISLSYRQPLWSQSF